ncbi:glycosyltransferase [Duganella sp. Root198D2]|uniref:glycosyltransferase n=1 Tax=Duganella sp. Root198D2 TaxID=1736489 RepID=UPI0009E698E8|nr:glycosyltransferase family 2 protein [Duganella sp. Root198D2]
MKSGPSFPRGWISGNQNYEDMRKKLSLSIISHGHHVHVATLLQQLAKLDRSDFEVILTLNLPEPVALEALPYPVKLIQNATPKGFGANHNAAFLESTGDYFVILNPDIELLNDPFGPLLELAERDSLNICAPVIVDADGQVEDSARNFPTPYGLFKRLLCRLLGRPILPDTLRQDSDTVQPDWVAGMFVMVARANYERLGGFNDAYFLYFEDVEFGARARLAGCHILVCKRARVIHQAQRDSHRQLRFMWWHVQSAAKFFVSSAYLRVLIRRMAKAG